MAPQAGVRANTLQEPMSKLEVKYIPRQGEMEHIFLVVAPQIQISAQAKKIWFGDERKLINCIIPPTSIRTRESEKVPKRPYLAMSLGVASRNSPRECADWFENVREEYPATVEETVWFALHYWEALFRDDLDGILCLGSEVVSPAGYVYPWWPYLYVSEKTGQLTLNAKHKMHGDVPGKWIAPGCRSRLA